jgi:hypothetical protein
MWIPGKWTQSINIKIISQIMYIAQNTTHPQHNLPVCVWGFRALTDEMQSPWNIWNLILSKSSWSGCYPCFVNRRSLVQISARRTTILIKGFQEFPHPFQAFNLLLIIHPYFTCYNLRYWKLRPIKRRQMIFPMYACMFVFSWVYGSVINNNGFWTGFLDLFTNSFTITCNNNQLQ